MARKQRRMINIDVQEVSAVDWPAHGANGWVIRKSADTTDDLPVGAHELSENEAALAEPILRGVPNGSLVEWEEGGKGSQLGVTASGRKFLLTVAAQKRAALEQAAVERGLSHTQRG